MITLSSPEPQSQPDLKVDQVIAYFPIRPVHGLRFGQYGRIEKIFLNGDLKVNFGGSGPYRVKADDCQPVS